MLSLRNYMIEIETKEEGQIKDITDMVEQKVEESGMKNGIVNLFVQGTTASLIIIENESGLLKVFLFDAGKSCTKVHVL